MGAVLRPVSCRYIVLVSSPRRSPATPAPPRTDVRPRGRGPLRVGRMTAALVLVADDDEDLLERASMQLEMAGYRVAKAHDGTEAGFADGEGGSAGGGGGGGGSRKAGNRIRKIKSDAKKA